MRSLNTHSYEKPINAGIVYIRFDIKYIMFAVFGVFIKYLELLSAFMNVISAEKQCNCNAMLLLLYNLMNYL